MGEQNTGTILKNNETKPAEGPITLLGRVETICRYLMSHYNLDVLLSVYVFKQLQEKFKFNPH